MLRRIENYSDRVELDDELLPLTYVYFLLDVCLSAGRRQQVPLLCHYATTMAVIKT